MKTKTKCIYKQVNGDCTHPDNRSCGDNCIPTDETIAKANMEPCLDPAEYRGNDYGDDEPVSAEDIYNENNPPKCPMCLDHLMDEREDRLWHCGFCGYKTPTDALWQHYFDTMNPRPTGRALKTHLATEVPLYKSNFGHNKAGEPEKADNITRFTCYNCLHTVKYLFDDGRCKDCTGFTVEEVRGG